MKRMRLGRLISLVLTAAIFSDAGVIPVQAYQVGYEAEAVSFAMPAILPDESEEEAALEREEEGNWYEDYSYTIDQTENIIWLEKYNGAGGTLQVPAETTINGIKYKTGIARKCYGAGLTEQSNRTINSISFEEGVRFHQDSSEMFENCQALTNLDLSGVDTSAVENMSNMFDGCLKLESLDVRSFNTSKVTDMSEMFRGLYSLKTLDVTGFDTSQHYSKFYYKQQESGVGTAYPKLNIFSIVF